jgi:hypothetical protein
VSHHRGLIPTITPIRVSGSHPTTKTTTATIAVAINGAAEWHIVSVQTVKSPTAEATACVFVIISG